MHVCEGSRLSPPNFFCPLRTHPKKADDTDVSCLCADSGSRSYSPPLAKSCRRWRKDAVGRFTPALVNCQFPSSINLRRRMATLYSSENIGHSQDDCSPMYLRLAWLTVEGAPGDSQLHVLLRHFDMALKVLVPLYCFCVFTYTSQNVDEQVKVYHQVGFGAPIPDQQKGHPSPFGSCVKITAKRNVCERSHFFSPKQSTVPIFFVWAKLDHLCIRQRLLRERRVDGEWREK